MVWNLTGGAVHATDVTNAGRTMLYDIHRLEWSDEMLDLLDVPRARAPPGPRLDGALRHDRRRPCWGAEVPIRGVAGDQHAALFGQRCTRPGQAKATYGTGCFLLYQTGDVPVTSDHGLLTTLAWQLEGEPPQYALEGAVFVAGAAVQWLRDELGLIEAAADVETLAASVDGAGGVGRGCRRLPGWGRRTGTPTPGARSWG